MNAWAESPALWAVGALTAILTAYYMGRCYLLAFRGQQRWLRGPPERRRPAHAPATTPTEPWHPTTRAGS